MSKQETTCIHGFEGCNCWNETLIQAEIEIFGDHVEIPQETLDAYAERNRVIGLEMDKFTQSLPDWLTDAQIWDLWLMNESERKVWLKANAPVKVEVVTTVEMVNSPYVKTSLVPERKLEKLGGVRF